MRTFTRQISVLFTRGSERIDLSETGRTLNIAFTVERNLDIEPSTAEITIFNLSEDTRQKLTKGSGWTVELAAGYGLNPHPWTLDAPVSDFEQNTNVIFKGDVRMIRHRREPPVLATDIEADDGGEASKKYITRHFPPRTTVGTVFQWLQQESGLGAGNILRIASIRTDKGLPDRLENGTTIRGYAVEELNDLARGRGAIISSQNGEAIVLRPGEPLPGVPLTTVAPNTGLIGYPYVDSEGILTLNHRLLPNVFPGAPVEVRSEFVKGRFVVERAVYSGALWEDDFNIEIEARAFNPEAAEAAA